MEQQFDIPIVLFIFKRKKAVEVIKRIKEVKPSKIYILADQGRDAPEKEKVAECRKLVEDSIDWKCEIIKNYADENRGVYENIGLGAKWVFERERWAIFLEDDNLPEVSFFRFCEEMLKKYEQDTRILWVCGTNYLGKYVPHDKCSYVFTRHMLPCGWASWAQKFTEFYDGELSLCSNNSIVENVRYNYCNKKVYEQYKKSWMSEYHRIKRGGKPVSWDYQIDFAIKANSLYGICPCNNQIRNIGVDNDSIHGGISFSNEMTRRFCSMSSYPMEFPLVHPKTVLEDKIFEKQIGDIILYPLSMRIKAKVSLGIRKLFGIPKEKRIVDWLKRKK